MNYQVVSFNYKKCDLEIREQISFQDDDSIRVYLNLLTGFDFILEAFVVNTCNRIEIIAATKDNFSTYHTIIGILCKETGVDFAVLESSVLNLEDEEAIKHIFSVVSSLDSLVIGEAQITGQVKDAFRLSYENNTAGKELNRVISYAVKCAAEVRNATNISQNPISIASVAVAQAKADMNGSLTGMTGIVVGSGEMGRLAAKHLLRADADVLLLSRTKANAEKLAQELNSENVNVVDLEKLHRLLNRYRLLFSATSSPDIVISNAMIEYKEADRLWFDMAIPRDIEEPAEANIKLYRIDDLQEISTNNHAMREEQALQASEVVLRYTNEFFLWLQTLTIEPLIKGIRLSIKDVIETEVQRSIDKGYLPEQFSDNAKRMITQVFDKYLHIPTKNLRDMAKENDGQVAVNAFKKVFEINTDDSDLTQYKKNAHKPSPEMMARFKGEKE
ncbi:MAG: glutamyl-tRNA reductase [Sulfurovum sp.]|nr:glutamyl-tRNA reductase [Sulfurovum sp.]